MLNPKQKFVVTETINKLNSNEIFVFGSNRAGRHGKGAALIAANQFGAVYGVGEGLEGNSYALPTKGYKIEKISLEEIQRHVQNFINHAKLYPNLTYYVTRVGCGLAGYSDKDIAPMFHETLQLDNVLLPEIWIELLN